MLQGIQLLRAFAATLVVVQHATYYASLSTETNISGFLALNLGGLGVYLFFCISGAVMSLASNTTASRFVAKRITRIYPPYFLAMGLSGVLLWFATSGTVPDMTFDLSMLLLPSGTLNSSFSVPYWTLIYEMFFYALLWAMLGLGLSAKARAWMMAAWSIVIIAASCFVAIKDPLMPNALEIFVSPLNLYFAAGYVLMYFLTSTDRKPMLALLLALAFSSTMYLVSIRYVFVSGLLSCGLIYLATMVSKAPRWSTSLGNWSYGIYLFHLPPISALFLCKVGTGPSFASALALYFLVGATAGIAFGVGEYWLHRRGMTAIRRPAPLSRQDLGTLQPAPVAPSEPRSRFPRRF